MSKTISRCRVEAHSVTEDKHGHLAVTLRRLAPTDADCVEMAPNGDGDVIMRIRPGLAPGSIRPGAHYNLVLFPAD